MIRLLICSVVFVCGCATTTENLNNEGIALANQQKYQQALQKFLEAYRQKPDRFENCLNVAQMYVMLKDPQQAIVYIDKALELNAQVLDIHILKMQVLLLQGKKAQALEILDSVAEKNHNNPRLYALLLSMGDNALSQKKWEESRQWYQKAIDLSPEESKAYIALSRALIFKGSHAQNSYENFATSSEVRDSDFNKAKAALRKAVYLDKDSVDAHLMLGMIAMQTQNYQDAQLEFAEVLRIDSNHLIALTAASFNQSQMGNISKSMEYLQSAQQLYPDRAEPLWLKANLLIQQQSFSEAVATYITIWTKFPNLRDSIVQNFRMNFSHYFPWLVKLITDSNQQIADFSFDMLKEVSRQNFARDVAKWQMWYKEKGQHESQKN
ncbi:tetratricopeptide repeat protein [Candidatus Uabimicrobium amorphum]|uniref:O-GlcNAc transferase n=1 Tax=Uabimicrobium amorphum TaxID=2596890 RepID=A0A5S9F684_UABAM|nr:tetratricopeptide repeat protein [Candidatus Uabimicrobium amorphum]BBM87637.1 O-GlcNAc transferase [Candidatus Uabimicrobium amorphum]